MGGGRAQHKVTGAVLHCLCQLCLHIGVHHPQRSLLFQKVRELVEAKSSQPVLWRAFQILTLVRQSPLLGPEAGSVATELFPEYIGRCGCMRLDYCFLKRGPEGFCSQRVLADPSVEHSGLEEMAARQSS